MNPAALPLKGATAVMTIGRADGTTESREVPFNVSPGTPELRYDSRPYYAELFADILADVNADDPGVAERILQGFTDAVTDWMIYHEKQADEYKRVFERIRQAQSM